MNETMSFSAEIGIIGGALFVIAFGLLNFGVIKSTSPVYQALNFLGAVAFVYTALRPFNIGLFITEAVWAIVAVYGLYKIFFRKKSEVAQTGETRP